ncbi:MAG: ATP synthase F0 subunit B [Acidobacteria bacterium]|jgi:F-type H+-transporting ATPase subunit b|nr:ATP synthase F0 subunit B [Acidobacteriota bacterium]
MNKYQKLLIDRAAVIGTILLILLSAWSSPVFAFTEDGTPGSHQQTAEEHHGFNWKGFFGKIFDSTLLFGGIIYLLRKPLINLLVQKSEEIKSDIIDREQLLDSKSIQLTKIRERLEKIEEEIQAIKFNAEKNGLEEKKNIEELGKNEAQRILALTEEEITNRMEIAVRNLKEKMADLTIENFKKDIAANMTPAMHERLIEKNIDILSGDGIERK